MSNEQNPGVNKVNPALRQLLQVAMQTAQNSLHDRQNLLPGCIALGHDGKYRLGVAVVGGTEGSNQLVIRLRGQAASCEIVAAALYRDVRVRLAGAAQDVNAIHVVLEDTMGQALQAFQVYRKDALGNYAFDKEVVEQASPSIF